MKQLRIKGVASDVIISLYVIVTLFLRFKLESETPISTIESLVMGICFVVIIWALIKLEILNPNWFGLFPTKK